MFLSPPVKKYITRLDSEELLTWPTKYQWRHFFKILNRNEQRLLAFFFFLFFLSSIVPLRSWYLNHTAIGPDNGGAYIEAMIGTPRYLNPLLAPVNDADRDLSAIIYSSLLKRDNKGNLMLDAAENYSVVDQDRKVYELSLKKNIKWHDRKNLTVDDVIFTVRRIQNPDYNSPLRISLSGVEVEKVNDYTIRFKLKNPYSPFLDNLTFGILPKHIWEKIPPASFPLAEQNLKPIGSGPYKFKDVQKDSAGKIKKIELTGFSDYFSGRPFIDTLTFNFYKDEESAISAFNNGGIDGVSLLSADNIGKLKIDFNLNKFIMPRYFAAFFNQDANKALTDKNVRRALNIAVNKKEVVEKIINGQAVEIDSPIPDFIFNDTSDDTPSFAISQNPNPNSSDATTSTEETGLSAETKKAKEILESNGWSFSEAKTDSGTTTSPTRQKIIKKDNKEQEILLLEISLLTVDWPQLVATANYLKSSWENIGAKVDIDVEQPADAQELIRAREYQILLFGQILGADPDPFAFWHSSQIKDPGLNLALYANKEADKLLETIRQETDTQKKIAEFDQFNKLIVQDFPVVFLYSPIYLYPTTPRIKGIELKNSNSPSARFVGIEKWYIKTKRYWK
ncbi:MAG: hypothetical protein HY813_02470 [Candidatus Portnoybacteria bacterium]|nr:hypothetical protein [Candidatus Portnoybacteria bacterium]